MKRVILSLCMCAQLFSLLAMDQTNVPTTKIPPKQPRSGSNGSLMNSGYSSPKTDERLRTFSLKRPKSQGKPKTESQS